MKAAQISEYGDASVVKVNEIDKPSAKAGQVLVEVHATSLNPFDTIVRAGYMKDMIPLELPVTLGGDIAGEVVELGEGVTDFAVGDKVYGQANVVAGNSGAFAEYAATVAGQVAKMPESLDFRQAASLPLVGVSALQALNEHIKLAFGQKILILGGSGGIGSVAIQLARHIGANVVTITTGEGIEYAKSLGADTVVDYKTQDISELGKDFDAVFDTVSAEEFEKALHLLKKGGVGVTMSGDAKEALVTELGVTTVAQMTKVSTEALNSLTKLVDAKVVVPRVGKEFALDQIKEAFEARESGSINGKVIITIK